MKWNGKWLYVFTFNQQYNKTKNKDFVCNVNKSVQALGFEHIILAGLSERTIFL